MEGLICGVPACSSDFIRCTASVWDVDGKLTPGYVVLSSTDRIARPRAEDRRGMVRAMSPASKAAYDRTVGHAARPGTAVRVRYEGAPAMHFQTCLC
jgi:hypothetical protein